MSAISITAFPYPTGTINLTSLTEEGGVFSLRHGITGADWWTKRDNGNDWFKKHGLFQCKPSLNNGMATTPAAYDAGLTRQFVAQDTQDSTDEDESQPDHVFVQSNGVDCNNDGAYAEWNLTADRKLRKFYCPFQPRGAGGSGSWTVTATLSDGSPAATPLVLTDVGGWSTPVQRPFMVTFRANKPSTCQIRLTRTSGGGGAYIMALDPCWIPIPGPEPTAGLPPFAFGR